MTSVGEHDGAATGAAVNHHGAAEHIPLLFAPGRAIVEASVASARDWLFGCQTNAGFWCAQLEGDTTLESYWILLDAFMGRRDGRAHALAQSIRERVLPNGGWPQYPGGPPDLSVSCVSYFALKLMGDREDDPRLRQSRDVIVTLGGAERSNTYARYYFALFGQYPWSAVPAIPPEMVLLPAKGPFDIHDMSSWSRTIFVPLSIVYAHRPICVIPPDRGIRELFANVEGSQRAAPIQLGWMQRLAQARPRSRAEAWQLFFFATDRLLKRYEPHATRLPLRRRALARAARWMLERLPGSDGLSAILPAMANSIMALRCLGYDNDHALLAEQLRHLDGLLFSEPGGSLRMQPCISPVWDTLQSCHALLMAGVPGDTPALRRAASWLLTKQTRSAGDWAQNCPVPPGGWYFEGRNEPYPDVDDTCMALMVLAQTLTEGANEEREAAIERGLAWMLAMQNQDGGWAAFDRGNDKEWLTFVPFADHNAMIDPSTPDITARVLECLSHFPRFSTEHPVVERALRYLRTAQHNDGSWYGRWGVNYIYGTWQVLRGLAAIGDDMNSPTARRGMRWLLEHQNPDGGWGESIASYDDPKQKGRGRSTPSQTAWALMGLMSARQTESPAVRRGIQWLLDRQTPSGTWEQPEWSGTGFPKVFYLNYHGYRHYFPLMALGQYRAARFGEGNTARSTRGEGALA
jgi:squalene-hopene/tetraprenyl-beta-curcumene cyclase